MKSFVTQCFETFATLQMCLLKHNLVALRIFRFLGDRVGTLPYSQLYIITV